MPKQTQVIEVYTSRANRPTVQTAAERKKIAHARVEEVFKFTQKELKKPTVIFIRCRHCRQTKHNKHFIRNQWCWNLCRDCARNHNKIYTKLKKSGKKRVYQKKIKVNPYDLIENSLKEVEAVLNMN